MQITKYSVSAIAALALVIVATRTSVASGQGTAIVRLQSSLPGVAQIGNTNITGTSRVGNLITAAFRFTDSPVSGYVLTGDGSGFGSWKAPDLVLPYEDSGVANNTVGLFRIINNGSNAAIEGRNDSGAFGKLGGDNYGVYGESATTFNYGSLGNSDNGVAGSNNFASTYGYIGGTLHGVWGETGELNGAAIYGRNYTPSGAGYGVYATSLSAASYGILAQNTSASAGNVTAARFNVPNAPSGIAVYATSKYIALNTDVNDTTGATYGLYASANSPGARAAYGFVSNSANIDYGFRGQASAGDYGLYAVGDTGASGVKAFRIDHPLDPYNKYLKHYSAEGPQPMNVYSGTVVTDAKGAATVELPSYYDSINRNPRYTLTVVDEGEDFVLAKVSRRLAGRTFEIRTSKPNVEVSWMIQAERYDAWVQAHAPVVEEEKVGQEKGKLQHPELLGQTEDMGMDPAPSKLRHGNKPR